MGSEKRKGAQGQPKSIQDVEPRVKEGAHAIYLFLGAATIVAIVWVLYIAGAVSQGFLVGVIATTLIAWALLSNGDFAIREFFLSDTERRKGIAAQEFTPDVNATDQVMGISLYEPDETDGSQR